MLLRKVLMLRNAKWAMLLLRELSAEEEELTEPMVESHHISLPMLILSSTLWKRLTLSPELIKHKLDWQRSNSPRRDSLLASEEEPASVNVARRNDLIWEILHLTYADFQLAVLVQESNGLDSAHSRISDTMGAILIITRESWSSACLRLSTLILILNNNKKSIILPCLFLFYSEISQIYLFHS